jgi:hypothetical protein
MPSHGFPNIPLQVDLLEQVQKIPNQCMPPCDECMSNRENFIKESMMFIHI